MVQAITTQDRVILNTRHLPGIRLAPTSKPLMFFFKLSSIIRGFQLQEKPVSNETGFFVFCGLHQTFKQ